jgi:hypothetical protein
MGGRNQTFGNNSDSFLPFSMATQARTLAPAPKYSEDQVVFSLRDYAVGTYLISLYANGKPQASEKLIIQK